MSWSSKSVDFITLFVEDLDQSKSFYQRVFGLPMVYEDRPWGVRTASFSDPGGHLWEIAQALPSGQ